MLKFEALLTAMLMMLIAGCAGTLPAPSDEARAELAPGGTLRIAVFTGNPVIGSKDKATGEVTGTTVILGRQLAARCGVPARIIEYTAVAKLVDDAKRGAWDIGVVAFDPARKNVLDFAPPHMVVDLTYLVGPGSRIGSVADVDQPGVRVAVARGAATALLLGRTLKWAVLTPAANETAVFAMLKEGNAEAMAQNRYMLLGLADTLPGARVLEDSFAAAEMTIVLPKGRPTALAYVGEFVRGAKKSGDIERAIAAAGLRGVRVAAGQ